MHGRHLGSSQTRLRSSKTPKRSIAYELDVYTDASPAIIGTNFNVYWYAGPDFPPATPVTITLTYDPTYGVNSTAIFATNTVIQTTLDTLNTTLNFPVGQQTGYYYLTLTTNFTTSSTLDDFLVLIPGNYGVSVVNTPSTCTIGQSCVLSWNALSDVPSSTAVSVYVISDPSGDVTSQAQVIQSIQQSTIGVGTVNVVLNSTSPVGNYYAYVYSDYGASQNAVFFQVGAGNGTIAVSGGIGLKVSGYFAIFLTLMML